MSKVDDWLARLIPRCCVLCNQPSGAVTVCAGCQDDLPWLATVESVNAGFLPAGSGCRETLSQERHRIIAALSYEYPVDRLITGAKFRGQLHFALALGELLAIALHDREGCQSGRPDMLVPVPLHRNRLARRGYNQALEIARPVGEMLRIELAPRLCERVRDTAEQTGLSAEERRGNLRNAFTVRGTCTGARVAILDDVITTGSTAAAAAMAFRAAGAAHVEVWAVARTL